MYCLCILSYLKVYIRVHLKQPFSVISLTLPGHIISASVVAFGKSSCLVPSKTSVWNRHHTPKCRCLTMGDKLFRAVLEPPSLPFAQNWAIWEHPLCHSQSFKALPCPFLLLQCNIVAVPGHHLHVNSGAQGGVWAATCAQTEHNTTYSAERGERAAPAQGQGAFVMGFTSAVQHGLTTIFHSIHTS